MDKVDKGTDNAAKGTVNATEPTRPIRVLSRTFPHRSFPQAKKAFNGTLVAFVDTWGPTGPILDELNFGYPAPGPRRHRDWANLTIGTRSTGAATRPTSTSASSSRRTCRSCFTCGRRTRSSTSAPHLHRDLDHICAHTDVAGHHLRLLGEAGLTQVQAQPRPAEGVHDARRL